MENNTLENKMDNREENKALPATESGFGQKTYTITERDMNKCIRALEALDTAKVAILSLVESAKKGTDNEASANKNES